MHPFGNGSASGAVGEHRAANRCRYVALGETKTGATRRIVKLPEAAIDVKSGKLVRPRGTSDFKTLEGQRGLQTSICWDAGGDFRVRGKVNAGRSGYG